MTDKQSLFRFKDAQVLELLTEAINVNPFEKGFIRLYDKLKEHFPPKCTDRTFKERLYLEMKKQDESKNRPHQLPLRMRPQEIQCSVG